VNKKKALSQKGRYGKNGKLGVENPQAQINEKPGRLNPREGVSQPPNLDLEEDHLLPQHLSLRLELFWVLQRGDRPRRYLEGSNHYETGLAGQKKKATVRVRESKPLTVKSCPRKEDNGGIPNAPSHSYYGRGEGNGYRVRQGTQQKDG